MRNSFQTNSSTKSHLLRKIKAGGKQIVKLDPPRRTRHMPKQGSSMEDNKHAYVDKVVSSEIVTYKSFIHTHRYQTQEYPKDVLPQAHKTISTSVYPEMNKRLFSPSDANHFYYA